MSYESELAREIKRYYAPSSVDVGTLRSAYADAAHMCDAIAKDIIAQNRHGKRKPSKAILEIAAAVECAGNSIFALRDIVLPKTEQKGEA